MPSRRSIARLTRPAPPRARSRSRSRTRAGPASCQARGRAPHRVAREGDHRRPAGRSAAARCGSPSAGLRVEHRDEVRAPSPGRGRPRSRPGSRSGSPAAAARPRSSPRPSIVADPRTNPPATRARRPSACREQQHRADASPSACTGSSGASSARPIRSGGRHRAAHRGAARLCGGHRVFGRGSAPPNSTAAARASRSASGRRGRMTTRLPRSSVITHGCRVDAGDLHRLCWTSGKARPMASASTIGSPIRAAQPIGLDAVAAADLGRHHGHHRRPVTSSRPSRSHPPSRSARASRSTRSARRCRRRT